MGTFRLTQAAQDDIAAILAWSDERFGHHARQRYEELIATAIRDAAGDTGGLGRKVRTDLGEGVFTWHLSQSRNRSPARVHRPRHFLVCRREGSTLIVGRVLHDAMDLGRHVDPSSGWNEPEGRPPPRRSGG